MKYLKTYNEINETFDRVIFAVFCQNALEFKETQEVLFKLGYKWSSWYASSWFPKLKHSKEGFMKYKSLIRKPVYIQIWKKSNEITYSNDTNESIPIINTSEIEEFLTSKKLGLI